MKKLLPVLIMIITVLIITGCTWIESLIKTDLSAKYIITYIGNGSDGGAVPLDNNSYTVGNPVTVLNNSGNLTKSGCIFYGWNTQVDGEGTTYRSGDTFIIAGSDVTLHAFWIDPLKIQSSDIEALDSFGSSVSVSENYILIGAHTEDTGGSNVGAVYSFRCTGGTTWDGGTKIQALDRQSDDYFGESVSISGDYALIGARGEDSGGNYAGAAYIFHRTGENIWDSGIKLQSSDIQAEDYFGWSVSISGDYAVIGAPSEDSGGDFAGSVYVFRRTGENIWDSGEKIQSSGITGGNRFGSSVSISGDYIVIGAHGENATGAAYIFHLTGTNTWDSGVKIQSSDIAAGDYFGTSVSISGDYVIIGVHYKNSGTGAAYIFHRTGTNTWDEGVTIQSSDIQTGDNFGCSVSISGDYAVIGAQLEDSGELNAGATYIFQRIGINTWDEGVKIQSSDIQAGDNFGNSVSIIGHYAIVGANKEDTGGSDAGAAYILKYE